MEKPAGFFTKGNIDETKVPVGASQNAF